MKTVIFMGIFVMFLLIPFVSSETCIVLGSDEYCCGADDGVCPMDYEDTYDVRVGCGGDPDPDCCGGQNTRWRECERTILDPEGDEFIYPTCVTSTYDSSCCPNPTDCVYDGVCYPTDTVLEVYPNDGKETCSFSKWCPEEFIYDDRKMHCKLPGDTCRPDPCPYELFTFEWFTEPACFEPDIAPVESTCCFDFSLGGQDFYNYFDVRVE